MQQQKMTPVDTGEPRLVYADETAVFALSREIIDVEVISRFIIDGEPASKARARFTKRGGKMIAYTPEKTKQAEEVIAWKFKQATPGWKVDDKSEFGVMAIFFAGTRQRRDVDNMLKLICDGLNKIAWKDDVQVSEIAGRRGYDLPENARTEVLIYKTGKAQRFEKACIRCGDMFDVYKSTVDARKYCGTDCAYEHRLEKNKRECDHCKKSFQSTRKDVQFCSITCKSESRREEMECQACGNTYTLPRSLRPKQIAVCSDECRADYWREHRKTAAKGQCADCGGPTSKKSYKRCASCAAKASRKKKE